MDSLNDNKRVDIGLKIACALCELCCKVLEKNEEKATVHPTGQMPNPVMNQPVGIGMNQPQMQVMPQIGQPIGPLMPQVPQPNAQFMTQTMQPPVQPMPQVTQAVEQPKPEVPQPVEQPTQPVEAAQ